MSSAADDPHSASRFTIARLLAPLALLATVALAAYSNSFTTPLVFEGESQIVENPLVHHLWPPGVLTSSAQPVGFLTFALNYAIGGENTVGYHIVNLAIHLAAALALVGLVRRTLQRGLFAG